MSQTEPIVKLTCDCGHYEEIGLAQAGQSIACKCGRMLRVPSLSQLKRAAQQGSAVAAVATKDGQAAKNGAGELHVATHVLMLTPEEMLTERVHVEALSNYVHALQLTIMERLAEVAIDQVFRLQTSCALLPGDQRMVEVNVSGGSLPLELLEELAQRLKKVASPPVRSGPLAFAVHVMWGDDAANIQPSFHFPFARQIKRSGAGGVLDDALLIAAGLQPPRPWWWRICNKATAGWLAKKRFTALQRQRQRRRQRQHAYNQSGLNVLPPASDSGYTIGELTNRIADQPDCWPYYGYRGDLYQADGEYDLALADFTRLLEHSPKEARALAARGFLQLKKSNSQGALADFNAALDQDDSLIDVWLARGKIFQELEAFDRANEDFQHACQRDPLHARAQLEFAKGLAVKGDFQLAIEKLDLALTADPHLAEAYVLRAMATQRLDDYRADNDQHYSRVMDDLNRAIRLDYNQVNIEAYQARAEAHLARQNWEDVVADCDTALSGDDQTGGVFAMRGMARERLGDAQGALDDCDRAIELGVQSGNLHTTRAAAYAELQQWESALADAELAIELDDQDALAFHARGTIRLHMQDFDQAVEDFERAIELAPVWPAPYLQRGQAYAILEQQDKAIADFDHAVQLDPDGPIPVCVRGRYWATQDQLRKALVDFDRAVELDPSLIDARFDRAVCLASTSRWEEAERDLNQIVAENTEFIPAYLVRAQVLAALKRYDDAVDDYDHVIRLCPTLASAYSGRGSVWTQKGEHERALADFREAIDQDPGSAETYIMQRLLVEAAYHQRNEQFEDAISKANQVLDLDEENPAAYSVRAAAHWYSEHFVDAIDDYTTLIELTGESFTACSSRGQVYAELGEFELALADLNRAIEIGDGHESKVHVAYAYSGRAFAYAGVEDYAQAFEDFERSIQDCPHNAWVHYNHGRTYVQTGEPEKAAVCFELALALDEPALSPRHREKAKAFLAQHRVGEE